MLKRFCDRCGSEMESSIYSTRNRSYYVSKYNPGSPPEDVDLCPCCMDMLSEWMKDPDSGKPLKPVDISRGNTIGYDGEFYLCDCGAVLMKSQNYCSRCGRKLIWDEEKLMRQEIEITCNGANGSIDCTGRES